MIRGDKEYLPALTMIFSSPTGYASYETHNKDALPTPPTAPSQTLSDPKPNPLDNIPRPPLGPMRIRRIQRRLAGKNIRLVRRDPLGPLEDLPERVQGEVDGDAHVRRDEAVDVEGAEDVEAVEDGDDGEEDEREPGRVRLEGGPEDEGAAVDALGLEGRVEADVGDGDGHPGEEGGDGHEVLEPLEGNRGAGGAGQVG